MGKAKALVTMIVAAACLYAVLHSISVARQSAVELQAPSQARIEFHYGSTERQLRSIGEGMDAAPK